MSSIGELVAKLTAEKQRADELEAEIARSNALADELIEQTTAIGFEREAAQLREAKARAGQAQNSRWLAEGHLDDAIAVLQAVLDGQKGVGTKIPGGAADTGGTTTGAGSGTDATKPDHGPLTPDSSPTVRENADGTYTYTTWLYGSKYEITMDPDGKRERPPTGEELLKRSKEKNRFGRLMERADDFEDGAKTISQTTKNLAEAATGPKGEHVGVQEPGQLYVTEQPSPPTPDPILAGAMNTLMLAGTVKLWRDRRRSRTDEGQDDD